MFELRGGREEEEGDPWLQALVLHIQTFAETFRLHKWCLNQKMAESEISSNVNIQKAVWGYLSVLVLALKVTLLLIDQSLFAE